MYYVTLRNTEGDLGHYPSDKSNYGTSEQVLLLFVYAIFVYTRSTN